MREKILKQMFFIYSDREMSEEAREKHNAITSYIAEITGERDTEKTDDLLYDLVYSVFMDGANMLLDFISGKKEETA